MYFYNFNILYVISYLIFTFLEYMLCNSECRDTSSFKFYTRKNRWDFKCWQNVCAINSKLFQNLVKTVFYRNYKKVLHMR